MTLFIEQLDVDEDLAGLIGTGRFLFFEEIAYVPINEMLAIEDFDEEIAKL